jgi:hypothetical protein
MSHASTDIQQQKKVSDKSGDQPNDSTISNSNSTDSFFKLPFEYPKPNSLSTQNLNRNLYSQRSYNNSVPSLLDRWPEISSEDSYSSRPPDCFSTEVSDSSDTTMASNMRAELDKSQKSVNSSSASSVSQLPRVKKTIDATLFHDGFLSYTFSLFSFQQPSSSSIDTATIAHTPKDNQHLNSKNRM